MYRNELASPSFCRVADLFHKIVLFSDCLSARERDPREENRHIIQPISCTSIKLRYAVEEVSEFEKSSESAAAG
jgi:hypothetical protein